MVGRLALIAGSGALVPEVIAAATRRGYALQVMTLGRQRQFGPHSSLRVSLSEPDAAIEAIRSFGATDLALAGGVGLSDIAREQLASFFAGQGRGFSLGDTSLSGFARTLGEMTGATLIGVHELVPELLAPAGHIAGPALSDAQMDAALYALKLARRAGGLDLGQAVVVAGRRAIAAEDISGTDALLARVRRFSRLGLAADGASPLVLAKAAKPDQPLAVDLPAIGPVTVTNARKAGVRVIAVQAGATLLIERTKLIEAANRLAVSVIGLQPDDV